MSKLLKPCILVALVICPVAAQSLNPAGTVRSNLVDVHWLEKNLANAGLVVLDASPAQIFAAKHIPGAVSVDLFTYGLPDAPVSEMEKRFQSWGISPGKQIVVYDQGAGVMATRLVFSLVYYGFSPHNVFVLDGGLSKWQESGLSVSNAVQVTKPGSFKIEKLADNIKADLPEVLTASGDPANNALLEALGPDWHFGQVRAFDRAGHIPYGVLLPAADFYNPDKTFKSPEEITRMLTYYGVTPQQRIYTYCGGGVAASVPFFALQFILNYPHVKMYVQSELGWLSDERGLPYWTYDAPFLMREAHWLHFWGGQIARMYGLARITVVDVRSAEAFNQGHVPFALNIPGDVFKANIRDGRKLAEIMGPAGVDPAHEAVIISGQGLTKDSALAFVALEKLGQQKVSMFIDSLNQWSELGFPSTKDPTVVGPKKGNQDVSIPPVAYHSAPRDGVVISDAKSTRGVFPKVFVASGANLPAKTPGGRVVHVAYTDLLNEGGTPKPAKEIWNVLTKAGLPRYAEVICYSDDPGEAAVNYFILKLMGYPDVKVLLL